MTDIEYQRMNLPRRFWTATWNNLNVSLQEMVKKYVSEAFASKTGKGLLLYGEEGRGKTYISAVIAKILREKEFQIYYLSASDISGQGIRSEEHTSELQSLRHLVCRLLLEKKK